MRLSPDIVICAARGAALLQVLPRVARVRPAEPPRGALRDFAAAPLRASLDAAVVDGTTPFFTARHYCYPSSNHAHRADMSHMRFESAAQRVAQAPSRRASCALCNVMFVLIVLHAKVTTLSGSRHATPLSQTEQTAYTRQQAAAAQRADAGTRVSMPTHAPAT